MLVLVLNREYYLLTSYLELELVELRLEEGWRIIADGLPGKELDHAAVVAKDAVEEVFQLADEDQVAEADRLQVVSLVLVSLREETRKVIHGIKLFWEELGVVDVEGTLAVEVKVHGDSLTALPEIEGVLRLERYA